MGTIKLIVQILLIFFASVNLLLTRFALFRLQPPATPILWVIKVFSSALSPVLFLVGILTATLGIFADSWPATIIGGLSALLYLIHIITITGRQETFAGFEQAFGPQWKNSLPKERTDLFLSKHYVFRLPKVPAPIFNPDISFYTIPGTDRHLLCDVWQPPKNIKHSGLGFIYLHGSAWTLLDKDFGTRTFFRHLVQQGHVIMDVAYRLYPETDFMGMVHDTKHAIAWLKANASAYDVNPGTIVIGGGSAGAHITLLAAYTSQNKQFTPLDLAGVDTSVRGVVALYGQSDLAATFYHTGQHLVSHSPIGKRKKGGSVHMPLWMQRRMGKDFHRLGFDKDEEPGKLVPILGANPDEKPETYSFFSPVNYVHKDCPPTLLIHGEHDILAPLNAIRQLHNRLKTNGVPVVMHILPQTDHAFDNILPKISPSAHCAFYDVERFLALLVNNVNQIMPHGISPGLITAKTKKELKAFPQNK